MDKKGIKEEVARFVRKMQGTDLSGTVKSCRPPVPYRLERTKDGVKLWILH